MPDFHEANPLDLFFFAADRAIQRLGLPGANSQLCLELEGQIDLAGIRSALLALYRVYPAAGSRLECDPVTGRPRWRLGVRAIDLDQVVRLHTLDPVTEEEFHHRTELLIEERIDVTQLPPMRFDVFRGLPTGDRMVVRWPHAFMDGRGGVTLLEEIDRLYQEHADPGACTSAGDELRDDFARLIARGPHAGNPLTLFGQAGGIRPENWTTARLVNRFAPQDLGPCRYLIRRLTEDQARRAKEVSMRVCGFARFGDFLRATAIRALHHVMPRPLPPHAGYSTLNLIDHRKRRQNSPVCHNFTNVMPIHIPARIAEDRKAVADAGMEQTTAMIGSGAPVRRLAAVSLLARVPASLLINVMHRSMAAARADRMPAGMGNAPSLPLAFTGAFSKPMPTFCGPRLANIFGLRPAPIQTGFAIDVNEAQGRMNVAGMFYESQVPEETMSRLIDGFVDGLLSSD